MNRIILKLAIFAIVLLQCVPSDAASGKSDLSKDFVLLETESFSHKGGWVLDQQFMDQMGSPFLLAHGMGVPVENAETEVVLPKGKWTVYARTWNWCSPWGTKEAPGRFKLSVDGSELLNELGTGQAWDWEYAGEVEVTAKQKSCTVALRDLTGFEGRCDAILFSKAGKSGVPNEGQALHDFRMKLLGYPLKPADGGHYDMVVVGAGVAGICAALHSARSGMKVALINDRPVPGGNNSVEVHVVASGALCAEPFPKLGEIVRDVRNVYDKQDKIINLLKSVSYVKYITFHTSRHCVCLRALEISSIFGRSNIYLCYRLSDGHLVGVHVHAYRIYARQDGECCIAITGCQVNFAAIIYALLIYIACIAVAVNIVPIGSR